MNIVTLIYLIGISENIADGLSLILAIVGAVFCVFISIFVLKIESINKYKKLLKILGCIFIILGLVRISIPSKECLMTMIAVPYFMEHTNVNDLPKESVDTILRLLKNTATVKEDNKEK